MVSMAYKAIYVTGLCLLSQLLTSCFAQHNWSEEQCKLLPDGNDLTKEFKQKASEEGVELVYLNLEIGNDSYSPLDGYADLFLPDRWVYARTADNPMLFLSYNYDILSWGLLNYQVRSMAVPLKDHPSGCLARLNSSFLLNRAIGKALLNVTNSKMSHEAHVVCVSVIGDVSKSPWDVMIIYFKSNVEHKCCVKEKESEEIRCEQSVDKPGWLLALDTVLDVLTVVIILYCPASPLLLPDYVFSLEEELMKEKRQKKQEQSEQQNAQSDGGKANDQTDPPNRSEYEMPQRDSSTANDQTDPPDRSEYEMPQRDSSTANDQTDPPNRSEYESLDQRLVYVDDESSITCSILLKKCLFSQHTIRKGLNTKFSFPMKLIIGYYCVIPFFFYVDVLIGITIKRRFFDEASKKKAALDGFQHFYYSVSSLSLLEITMITFAPFVRILFTKPKSFLIFEQGKKIYKCFLCKEMICSVREDMRLHMEKWPLSLYNFAMLLINLYSKIITGVIEHGTGKCEKQIRRPCRKWRKALIGALYILPFYAFIVVFCLILGAVGLCVFLLGSVALSLWYSPLICLQYFIYIKLTKKVLCCCQKNTKFVVITTFIMFPLTFIYSWLSFYWFWAMSLTPAYLLVSLSCRFMIRASGLTVMGLVLNKEIVGPFVAFFLVATGNILLCWRNFQKGYKEVTKMISNYWIELPPELTKDIGGKYAFPESLFLHICGVHAIYDHKVLPIISEFCRMLCQIASILIFLFLILCTVVSFGHSYDVPVWAPTVYMFASGSIAGLFFERITKGKRFKGAQEQEMMETIKRAVKDYAKVLGSQASPNRNEVDSNNYDIV